VSPPHRDPPLDPERARLAEADPGRLGRWRRLGPYLAERAWGTVREDYGADGRPWEYLPHDHARSRAYRWSEDGLAGLCDHEQRMCFAFAFWNERDPILKERIFGLSGDEGNHGEDAKEYWWYTDGTPTASWLRWRYHYPQAEFPYARLVEESRRRGCEDREFELLDTGVFDGDRYWQIEVDYAKAAPDDVCVRLRARNAGPEPAPLHVLPMLWFRNTWSWEEGAPRPSLRALPAVDATARLLAEEPRLGRWVLAAGPGPSGASPELLVCENETNFPRLFGSAPATPFPKDGIGDHVMRGAATVNPARTGTRAAAWYRLEVAPGDAVELYLRLRCAGSSPDDAPDLGAGFERVMAQRAREADLFYAGLTPRDASADEAAVLRQAFAGMVWSQLFYHYDVARWLQGDPRQPAPPASRQQGRNAGWTHLDNRDLLAVPDKWEYPWYAAWDLAFHCVILAHLDPGSAKHQLRLLCREWYMHPNGQLPAYEWAFGNVNPPLHAWAALAVFEIDGGRDFAFLARIFHKLLLNFTWWVNRKDAAGDNVFEGGFLGLDNVGPFDRSSALPGGARLEQSDGTAWMAMYCLNLLEMALRLAHHDHAYEDVAVKFAEHFAYIASAMNTKGLWDEQDGFYYDLLRLPDGTTRPLRARSIVGLMPIFASLALPRSLWEKLPDFVTRVGWFLEHKPAFVSAWEHVVEPGGDRPSLVTLVDERRLRRLLRAMLDEEEFLSPHGLRSLSRRHRDAPLVLCWDGGETRLDYEPAESRCGLFGGNSNWRGPVWFPLNYHVIESLRRLHAALGDGFTVELPTGSGRQAHLGEVADEIGRRLVRLFLLDESGRRPFQGDREIFRRNPVWRDQLFFHEYFHGDTGEGLGASHQTGWTALVALLIARRCAFVGDGRD
jgi:hypothetical protein